MKIMGLMKWFHHNVKELMIYLYKILIIIKKIVCQYNFMFEMIKKETGPI